MTAHESLERRVADHYASEPPLRAPDRVLLGALATIDTTHQRRGWFAPWRLANMNSSTKLAATAAAAIAVVAIGLAAISGSQPPGTGGTPTASPTTSPGVSPEAAPTTLPGASMPAINQTFRSDIHGITTDYPAGWETQAAIEPWVGDALPQWDSPSGDMLFDPARNDHLFLGLASQPLGGESGAAWVNRLVTAEGCRTVTPVVVDGADGQLAQCGQPLMAFVSDGRRGYFIALYRSPDEPLLAETYDLAFFNQILDSVNLRPGAAVDASPAPS